MRILLLTQLFQPEPNHLKGLAFAQELRRSGHEVEVLTGFPNYPGGRIYNGYRLRWWRREELEGVRVVRVGHFLSHNKSVLQRILSYASFALASCIPGLLLIRRPDVVHVYQGPGTLSLAAILLKSLFRVPYVLDVQDLWPDSVSASGMLRFPGLVHLLNPWCRWTYRQAERIVALSQGTRSALIQRGVPSGKIEVIYNWSHEDSSPAPRDLSPRADEATLAGRFNIIFAGNMGTAQGLDTVIGAARQIQDEIPEVQFVLVGDGVEASRIKKLARDRGVANVRFMARRPVEEMRWLLARADGLLIHLKDSPLSRIGIPQKTQAYLAAGKPILMAVRGDSADLVRQARAGLVCEPENPGSLSQAVRALFSMPASDRDAMGRNGREFYSKKLGFRVGLSKMLMVFQEAVGDHNP